MKSCEGVGFWDIPSSAKSSRTVGPILMFVVGKTHILSFTIWWFYGVAHSQSVCAMQGMMNNCWFRVKVGLRKSEDTGLNLTFEHPTQPGNLTGGWMVKTPAQGAEADAKVEIKESKIVQGGPPARQITLREVRKHRKADSCWIVVRNKVYDCTPFMEDHPGGADSILINGGMDATEEFDAIHSAKAQAMLEEYYVGDLVASKDDHDLACSDDEQDAVVNLVSWTGRPVALNPKERQPFRLIEKEILSPDVRRCSSSS